MRRGFKTWAEQQSVEARRLCGLPPDSPLRAKQFAAALKVDVLALADMPGFPPELEAKLLKDFGDLWSAATIPVGTDYVIVYNSSHTECRQESDLMHELAHIICGHQSTGLHPFGHAGLMMRSYNAEHEAEAEWLGACLQIPRNALLSLLRRNIGAEAICALFGCSQQMLTFRRNTTGIDRQIAFARGFGVRGVRRLRSAR